MLISRNWLQSYFETELPHAQKIADILMLHSFEIEDVVEKENDWLIDIDVLPNRAHDCLSHQGIAREFAALSGFALKLNRYHYHKDIRYHDTERTAIIQTDDCARYMLREMRNINVTESPAWMKERLQSIGQKSIHAVVDASNYLMFDLGQPIHVFDADKTAGVIHVRKAQAGETMTLLGGNKVIELDTSDTVIADEDGVLALAGVKGGSRAEVDSTTRNIIIEVANFDPQSTRITSRRHKILTDASKRYENGISSDLAARAMEAISCLLSDLVHDDELSLGRIFDSYPHPEKERVIRLERDRVGRILGMELSPDEIGKILQKLNMQYHSHDNLFEVHIPLLRLDLQIAEDLVEEIGRIYGYHNITAASLENVHFTPQIHAEVYVKQKIINILVHQGFSEIKTYSFQKEGERIVQNPMASDKGALRKNLTKGLEQALEKNHRALDYFGSERTMIFEIGKVYTNEGEDFVCSLGIKNAHKGARKKYGSEEVQLQEILQIIETSLGVSIDAQIDETIASFTISKLASRLSDIESYENVFDEHCYDENARFHEISPYPFVRRDVSLWARTDHDAPSLQEIIRFTDTHFLQKVYLFDEFEKDGRSSFAFSLIFQSHEKTLTDAEVDQDMETITATLISAGSEIR